MMTEPLRCIEEWYQKQCNGVWEHSYGVRIETLDNPGWMVEIDLKETSLWRNDLTEVNVERSASDWFRCRVGAGKFYGFGGANNLVDLIQTFLKWVESCSESRKN